MTAIKQNSIYLENERSIPLHPSLAHTFGVNGAIIIQQIRYWMRTYREAEEKKAAEQREHFRDGRWWVYNTYEQWQRDNFGFWSQRTIQRHINALEAKGVLLSLEPHRAHGDRTKWYTIDFDAMDRLVGETLTSQTASRQLDATPSRQSDVMVTTTCRDHFDNVSSSYKETESTSEITPESTSDSHHHQDSETEGLRGDGVSVEDGGGEDQKYIRKLIMREFEKEGVWLGLVRQHWPRYGPVTMLALLRECQDAGRVPAALFSTKVNKKARPIPVYVERAQRWIEMRLIERDALSTETAASTVGLARASPSPPLTSVPPPTDRTLEPSVSPCGRPESVDTVAAASCTLDVRPGGQSALTVADAWHGVLSQLAVQLPSATYNTWLKHARAVDFADGVLTVELGHQYGSDYLRKYLQHVIDQQLTQWLARRCASNGERQRLQLGEECENMAKPNVRPGAGLNKRDQQTLDAIRQFIAVHGYSPSHQEVADLIGLKDRTSAAYRIARLVKLGYIVRDAGTRRQIRVVPRRGAEQGQE